MQKLIDNYTKVRSNLIALGYFDRVTNWDMQTEAPNGSAELTSQYLGVLTSMMHKMRTNKSFVDTVEQLYANRAELELPLAHEIEVLRKNMRNDKLIPLKAVLKFNKTVVEGYPKYVSAKVNNNISEFLPTLTEIIKYNKYMAKCLATEDKQGYDVLLDMYEPNFSRAKWDEFFTLLRDRLVPFVNKIAKLKLDYPAKLDSTIWDITKQKQFASYLMDVMCFDKNRGIIKESEHPFTSGFHADDIRITNHYYEDNLLSAIFSVIHESGHALYEQNIDSSLHNTWCCEGASLGMHESQSRFYENNIGRSYEFWQAHYPKLKEIFNEELVDVSLDDFYNYVNKVQLGYIRVDADELTYPLHIMLRYDMEKLIIEENLPARSIAKQWNSLFKQYFGFAPRSNKEGVLQDVHWACGNFGYFPTYALGSAIASQLFYHIKRDIDLPKALASGTTQEINKYLHERIHRYGSSKYSMDILAEAVGEQFNANYYIDYLIEKYSKIYNISAFIS